MRLFFHLRDNASVGHRGRSIILFSLIWVLLGFQLMLLGDAPTGVLFLDLFPAAVRVGFWWGSAVLASCFARTQPTKATDMIAFSALVIPPSLTGGSYFWSAFMGIVTNGSLGNAGNWINGLIWAILVALILLHASWPEPKDPSR